MGSGALRHRVTLLQLVQRDGALGEVTASWSPVAVVWAQVRDLSGREWYEARQLPEGEVSTEVTIRFRAGVTRTMRVLHGTRTYDIIAVLDRDGGRKFLGLMCREAAP